MRRKWFAYVLPLVFLYSIFLVAIAPSSLLASALLQLSHGSLALTQAQGSVWSGRAYLSYYYPNREPVYVGRLRWRINPLWLAIMRVSAHWQLSSSGLQGKGHFAFGRNSLRLEDVHVSLPASALKTLYPPAGIVSPSGQIVLDVANLRVSREAMQGAAVLEWQGAQVNLSSVPLGAYRLILTSSDNAVGIKLETLRGDLYLAGDGYWQPFQGGGLKFKGHAKPLAHANELASILMLFDGSRNQDERLISVNTTVNLAGK